MENRKGAYYKIPHERQGEPDEERSWFTEVMKRRGNIGKTFLRYNLNIRDSQI